MNKVVNDLFEEYKKNMNSNIDYERTDFVTKLFKDHQAIRSQVIAKYKQMPKLGDKIMEMKYEMNLMNKTMMFFDEWRKDKTEISNRIQAEKRQRIEFKKMRERQRVDAEDYLPRTIKPSTKGALNVACKIFSFGLAKC